MKWVAVAAGAAASVMVDPFLIAFFAKYGEESIGASGMYQASPRSGSWVSTEDHVSENFAPNGSVNDANAAALSRMRNAAR